MNVCECVCALSAQLVHLPFYSLLLLLCDVMSEVPTVLVFQFISNC